MEWNESHTIILTRLSLLLLECKNLAFLMLVRVLVTDSWFVSGSFRSHAWTVIFSFVLERVLLLTTRADKPLVKFIPFQVIRWDVSEKCRCNLPVQVAGFQRQPAQI